VRPAGPSCHRFDGAETGRRPASHRHQSHCQAGYRQAGYRQTGQRQAGYRQTGHRQTTRCQAGCHQTARCGAGHRQPGGRSLRNRHHGRRRAAGFASFGFRGRSQVGRRPSSGCLSEARSAQAAWAAGRRRRDQRTSERLAGPVGTRSASPQPADRGGRQAAGDHPASSAPLPPHPYCGDRVHGESLPVRARTPAYRPTMACGAGCRNPH
jgi:hypothetical protein